MPNNTNDKFVQIRPSHARPRTIVGLCLIVAFTSIVPGCGGPSTEDLMMRAAMRSRPRSGDRTDDEEPKKPAKKKNQTKKVANTKPPETDQIDVRKTSRLEKGRKSVKPQEVLDSLGDLKLKPVAERKPDGEEEESARRSRASDNMMKIHAALEAYYDEHEFYPARAFVTESGFKTLSWRVEILPYLGYPELYEKFDHSRPWNLEPNKTLANYIPPEFTSDRFDIKTNFLLPAYNSFFFGSNRDINKRTIDEEDGVANTIMLVEVDDRLAVEWTKPGDYEPSNPNNVKNDVGNVRGDGAFAVWGNGWPVLLANSLSKKQFTDAFTATSGDGQRAGEVHRDIPVITESDASKATSDAVSMSPSNEDTYTSPMSVDEPLREPAPKAGDIARAQNRLKQIYSDKMSEAKDDSEKGDLAGQMLNDAKGMMEDPAGAFALQTAAIRLGTEAGEIKHVLSAVDQRVGRFEVDTYKQNIDALLEFAEGTNRREPSEVDGDVFLKRAIPVISAAIHDNDFMRASAIARHAYRLRDQEPNEEIQKSLNKLRVLLGSAKREYDKAAESLAIYREDPSQTEQAAAFGRFLCFIKGEWEQGLPLVIMGGKRQLREVAQMDINGAKTIDEEVALGDAWWELSRQIGSGIYRQSLQDRAAFWYQKAFPVMPQSLDRIHVKGRLDELGETDPSSPLALIAQLANDEGVDLNQSLASIADVGQGGRRNIRDDDDDE